MLPFRSNVIVLLLLLISRAVFYMIMTSTGANAFVLMVNTPYIRAKRLSFPFKCTIKSSSISIKINLSLPLSVFMTYLLSAEKKKNEALLPEPYPELKMF